MFWENQIKGKKGWTQRPLKAADSSLDMCLKRDAAADAKKQGKDGGAAEKGERLKQGRQGRPMKRRSASKSAEESVCNTGSKFMEEKEEGSCKRLNAYG